MGRVVLAALIVLGGSLLLPTASRASTGGPDAYGYVWVDSRAPSPTYPFNWIDITSTGTRLILKDDACTYEVPLGFQFRFYGITVDQTYICSNGFITFSVPDSYFADPPIPNPNPPNDRIVGLALDLNPAISGGVYFLSQPQTTPRRFIVSWVGVYQAYTTKPQTFQIVLEQNASREDGRILIEYRTLTGFTSALVGIENSTGSSGLAYPGPLGNNLVVAFLPPTDAALPPDRLAVASTVLAPTNAAQGDGNVPMLALDFTTPTNWVDVTAVRVTLSGLGANPGDVPRATLWLETNGDGTFTPGPDTFLVWAAFSGTPAAASLNLPSSLRVAVGTPRRVYVAFDIASTARVNDWIGARLDSASSVFVVYPDTVNSSGFPIDSYRAGVRTRIVASSDTLSMSAPTSLLSATIAQWDTDRPLLSLRFSANRNSVDLAGIHVPIQGTAVAGDFWAMKALLDTNRDGNYTPDVDAVLAIAVATGSPPEALLSFNLTVLAGSPVTLLLVFDVSPTAVPGHTMSVSLSPSDIRLPAGSIDRVDGGNFPAATGNATIALGQRPAIVSPWTEYPPKADGIWMSGEYLLGPSSTEPLLRPAGNRVAGVLTAQNNGTTLFVAVAAIRDLASNPGDGIAIAFDTDRDGAPTNGADDVYVLNASAGRHDRYNASASRWTTVAPCTPGPNASAACATAIGYTEVGKTRHRFYEFAIPLAELGVPDPIPPGTSLRFGLAGPPYYGVVDRGNRSTWPLVFGPTVSLPFFGDLVLSPGPAPNRPPTLNWTGEPGYEADGLEPESGPAGTGFLWKIIYLDPDNDPPAFGDPQLHLYRDGTEVPFSPFSMSGENYGDTTYVDGKTYVEMLQLSDCGGVYTYYFDARDARGLHAPDTPFRQGPSVTCPNQPPVLSGEGVTPFIGNTGTAFTYRVAYQDPDGQQPAYLDVFIQRGGVNLTSAPMQFAGWLAAPNDWAQGALFEANLVLPGPGTNYTFQFRTSDGDLTVISSWYLGPYVNPDLLNVLSQNRAPAVADEGQRLVPFLWLTMYTTDTDVAVNSLRVDRVGTASLDDVLVYNDTDGSSSLTAPDQLLDAEPGAAPQIALNVFLHVVSGVPVNLLILANLTAPGTADATVGFEIRDSSYFSVGSGDAVSSFSVIRSTRASVNVAPVAAGLTVDGRAAGSPGINHIVSSAPMFAWRFQDENAADVSSKAYNVSVSSAAPPQALIWFLNQSGSTTTAAYGGPALAPGGSYLLRVRVSDGRLWSPVAGVGFRMNQPPPIPTLVVPGNGAIDLAVQVSLQWNPIADPDGDPVTYHWWVSESPTFSPSLDGGTPSTTVSMTLQAGKQYYWTVGASDGYAFSGNATVWSFRTAAPVVPTLGEIRGRVFNGSVPLEGALVELLVNNAPVTAALTPANGTFDFRDLALRAYVVRISALGFRTETSSAQPTESSPVIDLGDVGLTLYNAPSGGPSGLPVWVLFLIVALLATAVAVAFLTLGIVLRRRRPVEGEESAGPRPRELGASQTRGEPPLFECPVCGRQVAADATRCECGAVFER